MRVGLCSSGTVREWDCAHVGLIGCCDARSGACDGMSDVLSFSRLCTSDDECCRQGRSASEGAAQRIQLCGA